MKQKSIIPVITAAVIAAFTACKTSEANYRQAYERTVAGRDSSTALESTIYGAHRRSMGTRQFVVGRDTADIRIVRLKVTDGENNRLRPYNVTVGQFKQLFNARSLRDRLIAAGYNEAFVAETAEPYYYVILSTFDDASHALGSLNAITEDFPVALKAPLPFIIQTPVKN